MFSSILCVFATVLMFLCKSAGAQSYYVVSNDASCHYSIISHTYYTSTVDACNTDCAVNPANKLFTYDGTGACSCFQNCEEEQSSPGTTLYSMGNPLFTQCPFTGYCGPNSVIQTMPGTFNDPGACAVACDYVKTHNTGYDFNFMNYVPSSKQCECTITCDTIISTPNAQAYSLYGGNQGCPGTPALRRE